MTTPPPTDFDAARRAAKALAGLWRGVPGFLGVAIERAPAGFELHVRWEAERQPPKDVPSSADGFSVVIDRRTSVSVSSPRS
jgi:hypothetical protein